MTYLVTGGTSPNGAQVVLELVKRGEKPVIFERFPKTRLIHEVLDRVKIIRGEISEFQQLRKTVKNEHVDQIIYANSDRYPNFEMFSFSFSFLNIVSMFNVLESARILDVKKVVFINPSQTSWTTQKSISEGSSHFFEPTSPSAFENLTPEALGIEYGKTYGLDFVALRFVNIYGPGRQATYPLDLMVLNSALGRPTRGLRESGKMQYIYTKDLARAVLLAADLIKPRSKIFTIGSDDLLSLQEVAEAIKKIIPSADIEFFPSRPPLSNMLAVDYVRSHRVLGFIPQYSIEAGLKDYIDWVRATHNFL